SRTCRHGRLFVIGDDLHKRSADVLVTPANNRLSGREGADAEVHKKAGEELRDACRQISIEQRKLNQPPCAVTTNVVTKPFGLSEQCKHLVHVVSPDCRRPNQDDDRRELLRTTYENMFATIKDLKGVKTVVAPALSMGVFSYPHREGARMTLDILLNWLDGEEKTGIDEYVLIVKERNFISNMRTVYRESEDQLPGLDTTNE
ncbi:MAG: macro domain-containing protein, partial [Candidatus Poseidoniaceae archaeon]|nr:macro domain-containing protein [Candidatus Poseidoniaceae archaeon]